MKKILPYAGLTFILLIFFLYLTQTLFKPGYIYHADVSEGLTVNNLPLRYLYTYSNDIGESLVEKARIPLFYTIYGAYKVLNFIGMDDSYYVKIKIYLLITVTLIVFIYYTKKLLDFIQHNGGHEKNDTHAAAALSASLLGGILYCTNYWFSNRITHFGLFFTTATVPIAFYYLYIYFFAKKRDFTKLVVLALLLGVFTATAHTPIFLTIIFSVILLVYLLSSNDKMHEKLARMGGFFLFLLIFGLISSYWILPFGSSNSKPDAVLSETIVSTISKNADWINSIRLMGYWLTDLENYKLNPGDWTQGIAAFIPLAVTLVSIYFWRKNESLAASLFILLGLGIFLATDALFSNSFYFWIMFRSPIRSFGWLFREYDKLGLLIAYIYSISISLLLYKVFNRKILFPIVYILYLAVMVYYLSFFDTTIKQRYTPVYIPSDYKQAIEVLSQDMDEFNTVWYPGVKQPFWAKNEEVRYAFSNLISPKPSIVTRSEIINYLEYLFREENIYANDLGKNLDLLGVKYLITRTDGFAFERLALDEQLETQKSLEKVFSTPILTIYKNNQYTGIGKVYTNRLYTSNGLKVLPALKKQNIHTKNTFVDFADKPASLNADAINTIYPEKDEEYLDLSLAKYSNRFIFPYNFLTAKDDGNTGAWKLGSLESVNHAETNLFYRDIGLEISQFDYQNGVGIARDGWQKINNWTTPAKQYELSFTQFPNLIIENDMWSYKTKPEDLKYYWNTVRSDKFDIGGTKALEISFDSDIPEDIQPHFKLFFYDTEYNVKAINFMYPDENDRIHSLIKVPEKAQYADFSIWTLSGVFGNQYSYKLNNVEINDISNNIKPISVIFSAKSTCTKDCVILTRLLKSPLGGPLGIDINGNNYTINTHQENELKHIERYSWVEVGKLGELNRNMSITLTNYSGFNSVNALLVLSADEYTEVLKEAESYKNAAINPAIDGLNTAEQKNPGNITVTTKQINPTKYELTVTGTSGQPAVLAFAKPYSKNWVLKGHNLPTRVINGYINGWYFDEMKDGIYTIEYNPQKFFYAGAVVSGITALGLVIYLIVVKASVRRSNSQG